VLALCKERKRLELIYVSAVLTNARSGKNIADMKSAAWREATKDTRETCQSTLADLNAHRKEHGC
jgi:hypothetical protein